MVSRLCNVDRGSDHSSSGLADSCHLKHRIYSICLYVSEDFSLNVSDIFFFYQRNVVKGEDLLVCMTAVFGSIFLFPLKESSDLVLQ